jgi:hypothetical protein
MDVFEKVKEVNSELDRAADQGINDAVKATGGFTFWALVGAGVATLAVIGLLLAF